MTTHSRILAWRIPMDKEPGELQSMGSQRIGHILVTEHSTSVRKQQLILTSIVGRRVSDG